MDSPLADLWPFTRTVSPNHILTFKKALSLRKNAENEIDIVVLTYTSSFSKSKAFEKIPNSCETSVDFRTEMFAEQGHFRVIIFLSI